jgi:hypothetical protein
MNNLSHQEQQLLSCIDTFKKSKEARNESLQPTTVRKKELEAYLEGTANQLRIKFQKNSTPMGSNYIFTLEKHEAHMEIYYRYRHFYTRHDVVIKEQS